MNADASGWNVYGYNATYKKTLDLQQAFVEVKGTVLGAKSGIIIGRQQFLDAPSYMLYNRETPNVPLSWNGFRSYALCHDSGWMVGILLAPIPINRRFFTITKIMTLAFTVSTAHGRRRIFPF